MRGNCNWSYQPTVRVDVAKIPFEQLLDMSLISRAELLRFVSANEGRYEGILAVSTDYSWAVKLRQVQNVKDPLDDPSGGNLPDAGESCASTQTGVQATFSQFVTPALLPQYGPHEPLGATFRAPQPQGFNPQGTNPKKQRRAEARNREYETRGGITQEDIQKMVRINNRQLTRFSRIARAATYSTSQAYYSGGQPAQEFTAPPSGSFADLSDRWPLRPLRSSTSAAPEQGEASTREGDLTGASAGPSSEAASSAAEAAPRSAPPIVVVPVRAAQDHCRYPSGRQKSQSP